MNKLNLTFIKSMRKKRGLTLQVMAEYLGFSNSSVYYKYENGTYSFKAEILPALAKILQCSINDFFNENSSKTEISDKQSA